jgi:hypothetical protein
MYIGGSWATASETRPVINPADESRRTRDTPGGRSRPPAAPSASGPARAASSEARC